MKKSITFQAACTTVALLCVTGFPKRDPVQSQNQVQTRCGIEDKKQYYVDFQENHNRRDQDKAFEAAKKYLACPDANDQEDALASLNLAVGRTLSSKNSHSDAIPYLRKAASYKSPIKMSPETYYYLAHAYEQGPYEKLATVYRANFEGKDETDEGKLALENLNQVIDRMIDAYARALALDGVKPPKPARRSVMRSEIKTVNEPGTPTEWMDDLTDWYRYRHKGSGAGLEKLIETILFQPLPAEPTEITSLPKGKK